MLRGDDALTAFLLAHASDWRERHGFGEDVTGRLGWASRNEPSVPGELDWPARARALAEGGGITVVLSGSDVVIDGRRMGFSEEVREA